MSGDYEVKLRALLEREFQPVSDAEYGARCVIYRARMGNFSAAEDLLLQLRRAFGGDRTSVELLWVMLSESVLLNYRDLSRSAEDRVQRTFLLAKLFGQQKVAACAGTWATHFYFNRSDFPALISTLSSVCELRDEFWKDIDLRIRLLIVIANSFQFFGAEAEAKRYFLEAHSNAVSVHDRPSLDAVLFNKTAFRYAFLRRRWCAGDDVAEAASELLKNLTSAGALQALYEVKALEDHISYWRPRVMVLAGNWKDALDGFAGFERRGAFSSTNFNDSILALEQAWCYAALGDTGQALEVMEGVTATDWSDLEMDELLYAATVGERLAKQNLWANAPTDLAQRQLQLLAEFDDLEARTLDALRNISFLA